MFPNYFGCKTASEEMIVDPIHEVLLCRTQLGVYVRFSVFLSLVVC